MNILAFIEAIKEFFGFSKQVAENKGDKIPMQKEQIEAVSKKKAQKAKNKEEELREEGTKDDWVPKVRFFKKCLSLRWELHAINQVQRILDAGHKIIAIKIEREIEGDFWLYIRYIEEGCATYYRVPVNQRKAEAYLE